MNATSIQTVSTAIMFQPKTQVQLDLLTALAQNLKIQFNYIPKARALAIKRELNATTLAAMQEAKEGKCIQYKSFDDFKARMYEL